MSQELVKCPCCDKMVPANDMELTYRKPDPIASMDADEIEERCKYSSDYYVCDDEYFYIRAILPLPVKDSGREYCLGVWVQVSEKSFNKIWDLWDDPEQDKAPPFKGGLANNVHLNSESINSEIELQLIGPTSRPRVSLVDTKSTIYMEQQCGITVHRASEYSDLCRN
ncbi:DUF2199 domain-containing protein [Gallaecimonas pentaromativorans]|uniref:DUF2199 domain-containing protein n=1 Tax=Gallaecimonas pentaromativorans TaxID=584787 RepID=UPI003A8D0F42